MAGILINQPAPSGAVNPKRNDMTYTNKFNSKLIETHWLASVSHHHYWFADFRELVEFQSSPQFDTRMTISSPAIY
jgi:hypothetical protein